jgi:hypothetical protein
MVKKSIERHIVQILVVCLLVACSPQKRLNRLIDKHPNLIQLDTIKIVDTIVIESYNYDTITTFKYSDTTIIINTEKVLARYYYDTLRQEIWHEIECKNDTIYYEKLVPIEKVVYKELSWWEKYQTLIYIGLILFVALIIYKRLTK